MSVRLVARARRAGLALTARDVFTLHTPAALAETASDLGPESTEGAGEPDLPLMTLPDLELDELVAEWESAQ